MRRVSLGCTVAIMVAAAATLTGCAGSSDGASAAEAPGTAVEDSVWDDVQLTLVNETGQQFTASATINSTDVQSYDVDPGESTTFSPSSCTGSGGDVRDGQVTVASGDTLTFRADNPALGYANVKFTAGSVSKTFEMTGGVNPEDLYCLGDWTVANTAYEDGNPRKITVRIGQKVDVAGNCKIVFESTGDPLTNL